jgi:UDP-glucose 4-epimerase
MACLHGKLSLIFDPLNDYENSSLTPLKLFERLKDVKSLSKVVCAAAS